MSRAISIVLFLLTICGVAAAQQRPAAMAPAGRSEALQAVDDASAQLAELEKIHARTVELNAELSKLYETLSKKAAEVGKLGESAGLGKGAGMSAGGNAVGGAAVGGSSQEQLLQATKQMQETQMSFNLQYLQLQNQMENENRQFTVVSNVMKTKHDTVKNAINNIR